MAGNVKEWVQNEAAGLHGARTATRQSAGARRLILEVSSTSPSISFHDVDAQDPFLRLPTFGIRCASYPTPIPDAALSPLLSAERDYSREKPVDSSIFELIKRMYAYEETPLVARTESIDDSNDVWRKKQ